MCSMQKQRWQKKLHQIAQIVERTIAATFCRSTIGAIQCNYCLAGFLPLNNWCNSVQLLPRWFLAAQQLVQFSAITASLVFLPLNNWCNSVQLLPRCFFAAQQLVQFSAITASLVSCRSTIGAIQCNYCLAGFFAAQQLVQFSAITASLFFCRTAIGAIQCNVATIIEPT